MRISDWRSDVCSSDLLVLSDQAVEAVEVGVFNRLGHRWAAGLLEPPDELLACGARYRTDGSGHQAGEKVDGTAVLDEGMAGGALGGAREHVGVGRAAALGVGIAAIRRQLDQIGRASGRERVCKYVSI